MPMAFADVNDPDVNDPDVKETDVNECRSSPPVRPQKNVPEGSGKHRRLGPLRMFGRALLLRCPRCGHGELFTHWSTMVARCPGCRYRFTREEGFALGASVVNLVFGQIVAVVFLVTSLVLTSPDPPMLRLLIIGVVVAIGSGFGFLPFSKTLWTTIDMIMHATMGSSYGASNRQPGVADIGQREAGSGSKGADNPAAALFGDRNQSKNAEKPASDTKN